MSRFNDDRSREIGIGADKKTLAKEAIAAWNPLVDSKDPVQGTSPSGIFRSFISRQATARSSESSTLHSSLIRPSTPTQRCFRQAWSHRSSSVPMMQRSCSKHARKPVLARCPQQPRRELSTGGENDKAAADHRQARQGRPEQSRQLPALRFAYVGKLKKKTDPKTTRRTTTLWCTGTPVGEDAGEGDLHRVLT